MIFEIGIFSDVNKTQVGREVIEYSAMSCRGRMLAATEQNDCERRLRDKMMG